MTDTISTYIEPPHSVFSVLEETVFKDPGDGLGPMDFIDGMLRRRIITALRGDIKDLIYCLKLIANRGPEVPESGLEFTIAAPRQ